MWMECNIHIFTENNTSVVAHLILKEEDNEVFMEFKNKDEMIICDRVLQYNSLHLDESNHKMCTFQSATLNRIILFNKESDSAEFLQILSKHGILIPLTHDSYTFVINRNSGQNNRFDIMNVIKHTFISDNDNVKIRQVDGFIYGTIEQILPTSQFARFTVDDAETAKLDSLLYSSLSVPIEAYPKILSRLLNVDKIEEKLSDMMKIKKQWELTTHAEWDHHCELRIFVHDVEEWIDNNCPLSQLHRKLIFNLAISLFTNLFGNLKYSPQLMFFIKLMISAFISDNSNESSFIANNGEGLTFEEAENMIYWHLKSLWMILSKSKISSLQESLLIRTDLSAISSSTLEMLNDRNLASLEFAFNDADVFFSFGKKRSEMLMMLVSAISSHNITGFRKNGIIASFVLLQEKLQSIGDVNSFINAYSIEIRKLDSRLLLYNIERLFASERH